MKKFSIFEVINKNSCAPPEGIKDAGNTYTKTIWLDTEIQYKTYYRNKESEMFRSNRKNKTMHRERDKATWLEKNKERKNIEKKKRSILVKTRLRQNWLDWDLRFFEAIQEK